jgi:hypothetical protein
MAPAGGSEPTGLRTLRELVCSYRTLVSDATRVMSRLKAIYRARAIPAKGKRVYAPRYREAWLKPVREPGVHHRAELLYRQLDALVPWRRRGQEGHARREPETDGAEDSAQHSDPGPG